MGFPLTRLQDAMIIQKTYERGANFTPTEEATFAMLTPPLQNIIGFSGNVVTREDIATAVSNRKSNKQRTQDQDLDETAMSASDTNIDTDLGNLGTNSDKRPGFFKSFRQIRRNLPNRIKENFSSDGGESLGGLFDSECIPCNLRINFQADIQAKITDNFQEIFDLIKQQLFNAIAQIIRIIDMFRNFDQYVDLCAFLDFMNDFVCVPDLQRIISLLMAFMSSFAFELNGVFDLIMSLIAPLLEPFLSNVVDMLVKYLLAVVRPIECIIDSIQNILTRLDLESMIANIDNMNATLPLRRDENRNGKETSVTLPFSKVNIPVPFTDKSITVGSDKVIKSDDLVPLNPRRALGPVSIDSQGLSFTALNSKAIREQRDVDKAAKELELLNNASRNLDQSDPATLDNYRQQRDAAVAKYEAAVAERNFTEIQKLNQKVDMLQSGMRGALNDLIKYIKRAVAEITSFITQFIDEWKKLIGTFFGGNGNLILGLAEKMHLVQLIALLRALVKLFNSEITCDPQEGNEVEAFIQTLPVNQGFTVHLDENGDISVNEDEDGIAEAVNEVADGTAAIDDGADNNQSGLSTSGGVDTPAGKKLKSLINFTGDPTLDTEISAAINALTTPVSVTFKCPLQTSAEDAQKVNQWIQELSTA